MASAIASASSIKQLDINELLSQSELVFEGHVIERQARWNNTKTDIVTEIVFRVDEVVVGTYAEPTLSLSFLGGTVGQTTVSIEGSTMPSLNESGVYFINSTAQLQVNPIVGWAQGHFLTVRDASGTMRMMTQEKAPIVGLNLNLKKSKYISEGTATGITAGKSSELSQAISSRDFKQFLRDQNVILNSKSAK